MADAKTPNVPTQTAAQFVQNAKDLPVMPPVAAQIVKLTENPDSDLRGLVDLIQRDASLAVRVLKIANSSFYSMPREIESIRQAIVLLGYATLRSVVVAASIKDVFARYGLSERLLWEHAMAGAVAANTLAHRIGGFAPDEAFVGGLVHDVGKLVMHAEAEKRYQEVMRQVYADEAEAVPAETAVFGFDHAQVGRLTLEKWGLPPRLVAAIGAHHDVERAESGSKPLAALLHVADRMCLRAGFGRRRPNENVQPCQGPAAKMLGLNDEGLEDLMTAFKEAYEREKEVFG
jgi:putative nucleotidyltransferase with HDIG domain